MMGMRYLILIFLKSESFAQSLKRAVESSGYRGTAVTTEFCALTEVEVNAPFLIILDRRSDSVVKFRRMRMLNRVSIVAVQEGTMSCFDEECLENMIRT